MGATLASVHSIEEYHEIQSVTATYGYKQTWIGGSDAQEVIMDKYEALL